MRLKSIDELLTLRNDFLEAYKVSTGHNLLEQLDSKYQEHSYYGFIQSELCQKLDKSEDVILLSSQTLRSFIFDNRKFNYYNDTVDIFRNYINAVLSKNNNKENAYIKPPFVGAQVINHDFKQSVLLSKSDVTPDEFYLAVQNIYANGMG